MAAPFAVPRPGHQVDLVEGSAQLFPQLVQALDGARREVLLETYIFDFSGAGAQVAHALERAARRGVSVKIVVDGFGTPAFAPGWRERFAQAGVQCRVYAPLGVLGVFIPRNWRRLHRKLCVVDGELLFCGGINILDDLHDPNHGPLASPRLDFAVRLTGPVVAQAREAMQQLWVRLKAVDDIRHAHPAGALESLRGSTHATDATDGPSPPPVGMRAALVLRDNLRNRARIERAYRRAIANARSEILIANAYFVPGGKMRRALVSAAQRGVRVVLLLQGRYEYFMQYYAARPVYGALLRAGIEIHEYSPSFLHAKVAVIDGHWATIGSSNLDPLSLLLAREANIVVEDPAFAARLRDRLDRAMRDEGRRMDPAEYGQRPWRQRAMEHVALALMRIGLAVQGKKYL